MSVLRERKTLHRWQPWEVDVVRCEYAGTNASAQQIAVKLGVSRHAVKGKVQALGLCIPKSPPWTEKEEELLRELVPRYSVPVIAKKLNRSVNAVTVKARRLGLSRRSRDDWFTKREVAEICGVDHKKVQRWIDRGALKASYHNGRRPARLGLAMWHIELRDLRSFLLNYADELTGRNVDVQQIVWIVSADVKGTAE